MSFIYRTGSAEGPTVEKIKKRKKEELRVEQQRQQASDFYPQPYITIYGESTGNKLLLGSEVEYSIGSSASYAPITYLGKPNNHYTYQHSDTKDISLSFNLIAGQKKDINSDISIENRVWRAYPIDGQIEMGLFDIKACCDWLFSATKPKRSVTWQPPELVYVTFHDVVGVVKCVISNFERTPTGNKHGFTTNSEFGFFFVPKGPRGYQINMTLIPIYDLSNSPFAEDIQLGNYEYGSR
jgi:hypothetical protein